MIKVENYSEEALLPSDVVFYVCIIFPFYIIGLGGYGAGASRVPTSGIAFALNSSQGASYNIERAVKSETLRVIHLVLREQRFVYFITSSVT